MSNVKDKVIIITGASSGIGEATAKKFAEEGAHVVLAARREERLIQLKEEIERAGGSAVSKVTDVTSYESMQDLAKFAIKTYGQIDVMFNNAGLMPLSFMDKLKVDEWDQMVDVNIKGVLYGIAAALPYMKERDKGHIITTASVAGHGVFPSGTVYCGTKFATRIFMEGLSKELAQTNLKVTSISPGVVDTELMNFITDKDIKPKFEDPNLPSLTSEDVANAVYYAVSQPDGVAINEVIIRPTNQG
ncbi:SDR family oxidoreductase [Aquibacillus koreensis]|uniref:SDR family oxidoreductase n=1 Tax=Aquibacillus koreensis TaxID=279446 RepID=A0A9X3WHQ0_9BACI|nr:SDR family oxidoreductase [Aquibacillus koreensis]MCT2537087.1 SDR family oxidoreductase [Aquibacillus koreensis]MDC3419930.1 SDR family oxidoreductase [Aquibacillus koreensis]